VFAVTTVVPLLIFVWTLHRLGTLSMMQSQVGLFLALGIALLGFYIFRRLMGQMSALIEGLGRVVDRGSRPAAPHTNAPARAAGLLTEYQPPVGEPRVGRAAATQPTTAAPTPRIAATTTPPPPRIVKPVEDDDAENESSMRNVPGLGTIREVDDLSRAMAKLWMSEANGYKGRKVAISVMNSRAPIVGTLIDLTSDGLLVEPDSGGGEVAISYSRLSGIDAA